MRIEGIDSVSEVNPAGLVKLRTGNNYRTRKWIKLPGLSTASRLGVFNNNLENGYRAFAERYFRCKTDKGFEPALPVKQGTYQKHELGVFARAVCSNLGLAPVASVDDVVRAYTGPKRKVYERARVNYYKFGILRKHYRLSSFIKFEKGDLTKAPRVINPRAPEYNLLLGKYLKLNEKNYFKAIAAAWNEEAVVIKGYDVYETARKIRAKWTQFKDPVAVGADASKFDMHVSREALEYEHSFYLAPFCGGSQILAHMRYLKYCVSPPPDMPEEEGFEQLAWLLHKQLDNEGIAYFDDGVLKFRMRGTRASGDLNTSLGNCIIMCALQYAWALRAGVRVSLVNNGDDCQIIMERSDLPRWLKGQEDFYREHGFRMVLEQPVYQFEQLEFCQSRPVKTAEGWIMVRNPETLITKGSMCLQPIQRMNQLRKWMMAIGVCEGSLSRGVPVIGAFARAMRRNGLRCSSKLIDVTYHGSSRGFHADRNCVYTEPSAEARASFFDAWGIEPAAQQSLEHHYDNWTIDTSSVIKVEACDATDKPLLQVDPVLALLSPIYN